MPPATPRGLLPGDELDYVERTTNLTVTATSDATAQSFIDCNALTFDGSTKVKIEFYAPIGEALAGQDLIVVLYDGGSSLGRFCFVGNSGCAYIYCPLCGGRFL